VACAIGRKTRASDQQAADRGRVRALRKVRIVRRQDRNTWAVGLVAAAVIAVPAAGPRAAVLAGRVVLTPRAAPQQAAMNPYAGSLGALSSCCGAAAPTVDDVRNVVVSLPDLVGSVSAPGDVRPEMRQVQQSFEPRVLGVPVGTTVDFPNHDPIFHNAFSYSKAKRFDLGKYGKGKSASVTFDKPGVVQIFCDIHSNMSAWVYVVPSAHVVQPGRDGEFVLRGVPAGTHTIEIWHPERGTERRTVTVTDAGARVEIAF
jgi:plastocyanin